MSIWDELSHFVPEEFNHPDEMDEQFLRILDLTRDRAGLPFFISDDYRPGVTDSAHGYGLAVDIKDDPDSDGITAHFRYRVVRSALQMGFKRIGVYDKHIHLDLWDAGPEEVLWIGQST